MIAIDNILVSDDVVKQQFVCDLEKCKGGCCEEGDAGAPLAKEEMTFIDESYEKVKAYLPEESLKEIERKGRYVYNKEFGWVTPTINGDSGICVYGFHDEKGIIKCAFEQAYNEGATQWKKPISCHLFPIIAKKSKQGDYEMVNYQPRETLCRSGCSLGKKLKVPAYQFLKEPLIRKYGQKFYDTLDGIASKIHSQQTQEKR